MVTDNLSLEQFYLTFYSVIAVMLLIYVNHCKSGKHLIFREFNGHTPYIAGLAWLLLLFLLQCLFPGKAIGTDTGK